MNHRIFKQVGLFFPEVFFFLAGMALCTGRASQAGGLYFFAILFPLLFHRKDCRFFGIPLISLGFLFLSLFYVFPFFDLLQLRVHGESLENVGWSYKEIFKVSRCSSSLGISGIFLLVFAIARIGAQSGQVGKRPVKVFEAFTYGLAVGMIVLSLYVAAQFFTGFNFSPVAAYRPDRMMGSSFYRVTGFANHPVSFAGFALAVMAYYWRYLCSHPTAQWRSNLARSAIIIVAVNIAFVFFSGSRAAVVIALVVLWTVSLLSPHISQKAKRWSFWGGGVALVALSFVSGIHHRFLEIWSNGDQGGLGDRLYFWRVHWQMFTDSPWIGHGTYFMDHYFRDQYYLTMGYDWLQDKYNAHNIYLEILSNIGLVGSGLLMVLLAQVVRILRRVFQDGRQRLLLRSLGASVGAGLLFGFTQNSFFDSPTMLVTLGFFWIMLWQRNYDPS